MELLFLQLLSFRGKRIVVCGGEGVGKTKFLRHKFTESRHNTKSFDRIVCFNFKPHLPQEKGRPTVPTISFSNNRPLHRSLMRHCLWWECGREISDFIFEYRNSEPTRVNQLFRALYEGDESPQLREEILKTKPEYWPQMEEFLEKYRPDRLPFSGRGKFRRASGGPQIWMDFLETHFLNSCILLDDFHTLHPWDARLMLDIFRTQNLYGSMYCTLNPEGVDMGEFRTLNVPVLTLIKYGAEIPEEPMIDSFHSREFYTMNEELEFIGQQSLHRGGHVLCRTVQQLYTYHFLLNAKGHRCTVSGPLRTRIYHWTKNFYPLAKFIFTPIPEKPLRALLTPRLVERWRREVEEAKRCALAMIDKRDKSPIIHKLLSEVLARERLLTNLNPMNAIFRAKILAKENPNRRLAVLELLDPYDIDDPCVMVLESLTRFEQYSREGMFRNRRIPEGGKPPKITLEILPSTLSLRNESRVYFLVRSEEITQENFPTLSQFNEFLLTIYHMVSDLEHHLLFSAPNSAN